MKALVFLTDPGPVPRPCSRRIATVRNLSTTPMALEDRDDPALLGPDWVVLRTRLTGICGSDTKQVLMDFDDADDNAMTAFISFPQVLGHEVVATVEQVGPEVDDLEVGQRVVLEPVAVVRAAGHHPGVPAVRGGRLSAVLELPRRPAVAGDPHRQRHRGHGRLRRPAARPPVDGVPGARRRHRRGRGAGRPVLGGVARDHPQPAAARRPGGRVRRRRARHHRHRHPPPLYPGVRVATVARWPAQADLARRLGATVFAPEPRRELVEALGRLVRGAAAATVVRAAGRLPGHIDVVYDTIGSPLDRRGRHAGPADAGHPRAARGRARRDGSSGRRGTSRSCGSSARTRSASRSSRAYASTPSSTTSTW